MVKKVGRIVLRQFATGLAFGHPDHIRPGIYDIEENPLDPGHYYLKWVGEACMQETHPERFEGLDLNSLFYERDASAMTNEETARANRMGLGRRE